MLKKLKISNYALIEKLDIDIANGLSVITGETGAGKSIIMGALALIGGQRADTKAISKGAKKCIVEAEFDIAKYELQNLFEAIDVDYEDHTTIRREITDAGKSRAFINDTPCPLSSVKMIVAHLVDIHSQHANLLLSDSDFQMNILDAYSASANELAAYRIAHNDYKTAKRELDTFRNKSQEMIKEKDYIEFQYKQLDEAQLNDENEQNILEQENERLAHSEDIKTALYSSINLMNEDNNGVLKNLAEIATLIRRISDYIEHGDEYVNRLENIRIESKDILTDFESIAENMDFDPRRQEFVAQRLDLIYSLEQKHRVETLAELITLRNNYATKLEHILDFDSDIARLTKVLSQKKSSLDTYAKTLTSKRQSVVAEIEKSLVEKLKFLGMDNAQCKIILRTSDAYLENGTDDIQILFSANKNSDMLPIATIASGGEISRVMLCLKSIIAQNNMMPTIIFDEIDTGVSGEVANRMGQMMSEMSKNMQVITITHLPQIASKGNNHYKVHKQDIDDKTISNIILLDDDKRIIELAEMLSGKNPSDEAIANARSLMELYNHH